MIVNSPDHLQQHPPLWLLLLLLMCITVGDATQTGFAGDVPAMPYDAAYRAYFRNYPMVRPCILTAEAVVGGNGSDVYRGCTIASNAVTPHALLLISAEEVARVSSSACGVNTTPLQDWLMHGVTLPGKISTDGIALVVSTRVDVSESPAVSCDMTCFLATVQHYNEMHAVAKHNTLPSITAVAFSNHQRCCSFSGGPHRTGNSSLQLPHEVTSAYNFVLLYFPVDAGGDDWMALTKAAEFNRVRWAKGYTHPLRVLETRNGMSLGAAAAAAATTTTTTMTATTTTTTKWRGTSGVNSAASCLNTHPRSCVPFGGWTVWASNADTQWGWDDAAAAFVQKTRKGAVALLVASTALTLVHGVTPGADCPASAIVATLSVLEALQRVGDDQGRDVYAFFLPGEHIGSIGSARFVADATLLECAQMGLDNCTALAYGTDLNFTTVNFSAIDTFLVVDQVAYGNAPLFYHVDRRVSQAAAAAAEEEEERNEGGGGSAQEQAEAVLNGLGVRRSATLRLPYSPITTLLDLIPGLAVARDKTLLTLTRYNTTYVDPDVFTVLDTAGHNRTTLSAGAVAEAADTLLRVLLPNVSAATVNRSIVEELWVCFATNIRCKFLSNGAAAAATSPDYSVGAMSASITPMQAAIEAALQRLGWPQTLRSPAVSRALRIPNVNWDSKWVLDEAWVQKHGESRYKPRVMSLWLVDVGARGVMVGPETLSLLFLLASMAVSGLIAFCTWRLLKENKPVILH